MSKYEETTSNGPIKHQVNGRKSISPISNNDIAKDMAGHLEINPKKVRLMHTPDAFDKVNEIDLKKRKFS